MGDQVSYLLPLLLQLFAINTFRDPEDSNSISCERLPDRIGISLVIFVSECMKNLGDEVDKEDKEEFCV